ncbi:MAG TPA: hypothetical protein VG448_13480, partial [Solirubrobacterales bacterium]|nr:hypothetical protein [Solirubrobacterales bacterium]
RTNYAKNVTKRLGSILSVLRDAGVLAEAVLSIQTYDQSTLSTIGRRNVTRQRYDTLLEEFNDQGLPIRTEVMMCLPGSTYSSFARDLQWAAERNIGVYVSWTTILPNTPMADPAYVSSHGLTRAAESRLAEPETLERLNLKPLPPDVIVSSNTFSEEDFRTMASLSVLYSAFQTGGVLKYYMTFLAREHGITHLHFLEGLRDRDLSSYPLLLSARNALVSLGRQPDPLLEFFAKNSWPEFYDEVREYLMLSLHVGSGSGLKTVDMVQRSVIAYRGCPRTLELQLPHDFAAYFRDVVGVKRTPGPLADYPPASFSVTDYQGVGQIGTGSVGHADLELNSLLKPPPVNPHTAGGPQECIPKVGSDISAETTQRAQ